MNGSAGAGGGGAGGVLTGTLSCTSGTAYNVEIGAGGAANTNNSQGRGGSGVLILKYPSTKTATFNSVVTSTTITDGSDKITFVTATSDSTGTVTFS